MTPDLDMSPAADAPRVGRPRKALKAPRKSKAKDAKAAQPFAPEPILMSLDRLLELTLPEVARLTPEPFSRPLPDLTRHIPHMSQEDRARQLTATPTRAFKPTAAIEKQVLISAHQYEAAAKKARARKKREELALGDD